MNWKNRLKNYNFWISLFSAVLLILQALKIEFDIAYINKIFTAVLGLLVVVGIISDPTRTLTKNNEENSKSTVKNSSLGVVAQKNEEKVEEEKPLPIVQEGEVDKLFGKNDIENAVLKLTEKLNEKINKINTISESLQQTVKEYEIDKTQENFNEMIVENVDIIKKGEMTDNNCEIVKQNQEDLMLNDSSVFEETESICENSENVKANENTSYLNIF